MNDGPALADVTDGQGPEGGLSALGTRIQAQQPITEPADRPSSIANCWLVLSMPWTSLSPRGFVLRFSMGSWS